MNTGMPGPIPLILPKRDLPPAEPPASCQALEPEPKPVGPFPTDCLPRVVAALVKTVALLCRVPEALVGCCALGVLSAAIGAGLAVMSGKRRKTRGNLFVVIGALSGTGKTEVLRLIAKPLHEHEARLVEAWKSTTNEQQQAERKMLEAQLKQLEKRAIKANTDSELASLKAQIGFAPSP